MALPNRLGWQAKPNSPDRSRISKHQEAHPLHLETSGLIALWARPDTLPNPVSCVAPTFSAAKGVFAASLRWKSVNMRPTRCEVAQTCSLPYRGFVIRRPQPSQERLAIPAVCRLQVGDTAD